MCTRKRERDREVMMMMMKGRWKETGQRYRMDSEWHIPHALMGDMH